jgi:hypothetical protein
MLIYFSYFCPVLKSSKVGNFAVRLALVAYVIINVAALFSISSIVPDSQKHFSSKSLTNGISLLINEEKEKEGEGDEHEASAGSISFVDIYSISSIFIQEFPILDFDELINSSKIYLQHCSLQI